ncbi:hypothetical protein AOLI_G00043920 [Acnodon oligacanthus]
MGVAVASRFSRSQCYQAPEGVSSWGGDEAGVAAFSSGCCSSFPVARRKNETAAAFLRWKFGGSSSVESTQEERERS